MSRAAGSDYQFIDSDSSTIVTGLVAAYETITGRTVQPGSADRLFISWVGDVVTQLCTKINYAGNQNIPSRAEGENLDALGELFSGFDRPEATAAHTTMRFTISEAQSSAILVPAGTRVKPSADNVYYATESDVYVAIGDTTVDVSAVCEQTGAVGNGYVAGQINTLVDVFEYYQSCENTTESAGGADEADDDEYYDQMVDQQRAQTVAGPKNAYKYFARSVSPDIADVTVNTPEAGYVYIYAIMSDGTIAGAQTKADILAACDPDDRRPLTDSIVVSDPDTVSYDISLTYYIASATTRSAADIEADVDAAVDSYILWQAGKIGRDINPSKLISMLMAIDGIKRVALTSPTFQALNDGSNNTTPDLAQVRTTSVINGGYEDD